MEGVWRIKQYYYKNNKFFKKVLYDTEKQFKTQFKTKITNICKWRNSNHIKITAETFDGTTWTLLEEWIGPTKSSCTSKRPRKEIKPHKMSETHYWSNELAWRERPIEFEMACGSTTEHGNDITGPVTCQACLDSEIYKQDLILYEVGCDRDYSKFEEAKKKQ